MIFGTGHIHDINVCHGKIRLLLSYAGLNDEVADPWYSGDFESTWLDVNEGCKALLAQL